MSEMSSITSRTLLDTLCPMHLVLNKTGHLIHAGPSFIKILPRAEAIGRRFHDLFKLKRPQTDNSMRALLSLAGTKLHLKLRTGARTEMKAVLAPLHKGNCIGPAGGAVINLSFGISIVDAVRDYALTSADFAPTDLTVEMLYLIEAKSAAMSASRSLTTRLQGAKIAAEEQAFTDTLTGLKNRRAMDHVLARLMDQGTPFTVMNLDLDYFKAVNDAMGHAAGDYVLQKAAQIMVSHTRGEDMIIRTGGDEFVLIFPGLTKPERIEEIAASLIAELEEPIIYEGQSCQISGSIGAAISTDYCRTELSQLFEDADAALYAAKHAGRGCHRLHSSASGRRAPSS